MSGQFNIAVIVIVIEAQSLTGKVLTFNIKQLRFTGE